MRDDDAAKLVAKKSYEIGYALCRIAALSRNAIAGRFEESALDIIDAATDLRIFELQKALATAMSYVRIGADTGMLRTGNASVILGEIEKFNSFLSLVSGLQLRNHNELIGIFSPYPNEIAQKKKTKTKIAASNSGLGFADSGKDEAKIEDTRQNEHEIGRQSAKDRQSAIAEFIMQSGNCRTKDVAERFNSASERTLRYDLQALVDRGIIERIGDGTLTFYRAVQFPAQPAKIDVESGKIESDDGNGGNIGAFGDSNL